MYWGLVNYLLYIYVYVKLVNWMGICEQEKMKNDFVIKNLYYYIVYNNCICNLD